MLYLHRTVQLPLTLETENLQIVKWCVDGAFATHCDMRSHTGGCYPWEKVQYMVPRHARN